MAAAEAHAGARGDSKWLEYAPGRDEPAQPHGDSSLTPVTLTVVIPSGRHTLKVRYAALAASHRAHPTVYRQFAYVLAPARDWDGFGGLDVTVHLPANWRAASTPALTREGDTLKGTFAELPADALALTVQAPAGWAYHVRTYGSMGLLGLVLFGGIVVCWRGGRSKGRRLALPPRPRPRWLERHAWPRSLGLSAAWGLSILAAGIFAILAADWGLPYGQQRYGGYGAMIIIFNVFWVSVLAVAVGFMIAQITAVITHSRCRPFPGQTLLAVREPAGSKPDLDRFSERSPP